MAVVHPQAHQPDPPAVGARAFAAGLAPVIVTAVAVVATGMAYTLWWGSVVNHAPVWIVPGDVWGTFRDAHIVGWGGEGILYQADITHLTGFIAPPGMPVALAPVAMLSGALHLSESLPLTLPHPSAWLLLGPLEMAYGATVLLPLDALGRRMGLAGPRRVIALWVEAVLIWPVVVLWGHPEDLVALGLALYALLSVYKNRFVSAGLLIGAALAFQPLVVLMAPVVLAVVPKRRWAAFCALAVTPAALLLVAPLAHAWTTTIRVLVNQPTFPAIDHPTPWITIAHVLQSSRTVHGGGLRGATAVTLGPVSGHSGPVVAGGSSRLIALGISLAVAVVVAVRRPSEQMVWWFVGLALALRCVFEVVMTPYYVVPALAVALVLAGATSNPRRFSLAVCLAAACTYLAYRHAGTWSYYLPVTVTLLGTVLASLPPRRREPPAASMQSLPDPCTKDRPTPEPEPMLV